MGAHPVGFRIRHVAGLAFGEGLLPLCRIACRLGMGGGGKGQQGEQGNRQFPHVRLR